MMNRAIWLSVLGLVAVSEISGQGLSTIKIGASLEGPVFLVDGQRYTSTQVFVWPTGSKHAIQFLLSVDAASNSVLPYQATNYDVMRYTFGGWTYTGGSVIPSSDTQQIITATPTITAVIAQVGVSYKVRIEFFNSPGPNTACLGAPANPPQDGWRYGIVYVDDACIGDTTELFLTAGKHNLNAYPYPGFLFVGWQANGPTMDPYVSSFDVTFPTVLRPSFQLAKRVGFRTKPLGLKVIVDSTVISTPPSPPTSILPPGNRDPYCDPDYTRLPQNAPRGFTPLCTGDFDFLPGSVHKIGGPQSQQDATGAWWVFSNFDNGLGQNDTYKTDTLINKADLVIANFVPGVPSAILTKPGGLKIKVDGRDNWPAYTFIWGQGEVHKLSAPATQIDARGRKYQFVGWSNKGDATQEVTVPAGNGFVVNATYELLGQVQVSSNVPGVQVLVDGEPCGSPCIVDRTAGSKAEFSVSRLVSVNPFSRFEFDSWSDGRISNSITLGFTGDVQRITAGFHAAYLLQSGSDPEGAASFKFSPASSDGFFAEGTPVTVAATPKGGFRFRRWQGDLSGSFATGFLSMIGPRSVVALLDKVPFIPPAGVKNAAADTADGSVAPGSIVAIYGENLAGSLEAGRMNPLAQTLGNVYVTVNDSFLPLLFVSPGQINAQIPSDLADGDYTLKVHWLGQPDVSGSFTVKRNAPGLYTRPNEKGLALALATHEDGSAVTADSPARRDEKITLYGTGFGPYDHKVIDGFVVPDSDTFLVADPVAVLAGELTLKPASAKAAAGMVGTTVVEVTLASGMAGGGSLDLAVAVNGVQSNRVVLPVE